MYKIEKKIISFIFLNRLNSWYHSSFQTVIYKISAYQTTAVDFQTSNAIKSGWK